MIDVISQPQTPQSHISSSIWSNKRKLNNASNSLLAEVLKEYVNSKQRRLVKKQNEREKKQ